MRGTWKRSGGENLRGRHTQKCIGILKSKLKIFQIQRGSTCSELWIEYASKLISPNKYLIALAHTHLRLNAPSTPTEKKSSIESLFEQTVHWLSALLPPFFSYLMLGSSSNFYFSMIDGKVFFAPSLFRLKKIFGRSSRRCLKHYNLPSNFDKSSTNNSTFEETQHDQRNAFGMVQKMGSKTFRELDVVY